MAAPAILWAAMIFLTLHLTSSYILLTANLEDVQAIAKQLVQSSVADQLKKIWRRASAQFNQHVGENKLQKRVNEPMESNSGETLPPINDEESNGYLSDGRRKVQQATTQSWLTKNASYYLSSIKKIMDTI